MASRKKYVVRIVQTHTSDGKEMNEGGDIDYNWLESLRYAGLITNHPTEQHSEHPYACGTTICIDLHAPAGISDTKLWSENNARRMKTFGFNAVSAPSTEEAPK